MKPQTRKILGLLISLVFALIGLTIKLNYYPLWDFINGLPLGEDSANGFFLIVAVFGCFAVSLGGALTSIVDKGVNENE